MRDMLFVSHANPEDNEFARWLALQLAREGYPVWCDVTKLLGGEDFWHDIEEAIRTRTIKVLYVLSKASNQKPGTLKELYLADTLGRQGLHDFIIPLRIDDLPYGEINIQLIRLNVIGFTNNWAAGLDALLKKLEQDGVSKNPNFNPDAVASWWKTQFDANEGICQEPERHVSNWFPIQTLPEKVFFHTIKRSLPGLLSVPDNLPWPAFLHNQYLVSFAEAQEFDGFLGPVNSIVDSCSFLLEDFLHGITAEKYVSQKNRRPFMVRLLSQAWEQMIDLNALPTYELANGARCFYFRKDAVDKDRIDFTGVDGKKSYRNVVGYKTIKHSDGRDPTFRYWHFAIQAKPIMYPELAYIVKPHVLFSDDGQKLWESKDRMHRARRSQCKQWWNAEWRDRILAAVTWLANGTDTVTVPIASSSSLQVQIAPFPFTSPVSYRIAGVDEVIAQEQETNDEDDLLEDDEGDSDDEDSS